jgi:phosphoglycerol transferase MdoB-like AlkP superfamily enzyme
MNKKQADTWGRIKPYILWYLSGGAGFAVGQFIPWKGSIFIGAISAILISVFAWPLRIFADVIQGSSIFDKFPEYAGLVLGLLLFYLFVFKNRKKTNKSSGGPNYLIPVIMIVSAVLLLMTTVFDGGTMSSIDSGDQCTVDSDCGTATFHNPDGSSSSVPMICCKGPLGGEDRGNWCATASECVDGGYHV